MPQHCRPKLTFHQMQPINFFHFFPLQILTNVQAVRANTVERVSIWLAVFVVNVRPNGRAMCARPMSMNVNRIQRRKWDHVLMQMRAIIHPVLSPVRVKKVGVDRPVQKIWMIVWVNVSMALALIWSMTIIVRVLADLQVMEKQQLCPASTFVQ